MISLCNCILIFFKLLYSLTPVEPGAIPIPMQHWCYLINELSYKKNISSHTAVNPSMYINGKIMRVLNNKIVT